MIVHLVDYDSKIPNLALMRVSSYHKSLGDEVRYSKGKKASIALDVDKIYISCIYKKNKKHVNTFIDSLNNEYSDSPVEIDVGGSGYDLKKVLSDEIESMKPDYSLYPDCDSSYGFSSRGCPRVCSFCIVRSKEGAYRRTDHPEKWYDEKFSKITFFDNNILCDKSWFFELTDWCLAKGLNIRFISGFDVRLIDTEIARRIYDIKNHHTISFAWDQLEDEPVIREKIELLRSAGFSEKDFRAHIQFYVYIDSDSDYDSGLYRCQELKKLNLNAFAMFNIDNVKTKRIQQLQRWANRKHLFWSHDVGSVKFDDTPDIYDYIELE